MTRLPLSTAAAGLLRALVARADADRNRILLTDIRSTDWQSLTFTGQRHSIRVRILEPDAQAIVARLTTGIKDAELMVPGHVVADILLAGPPRRDMDGSISVEFEALTITE